MLIECHRKAGDVNARGIIAGAIPAAVGTSHPRAPVVAPFFLRRGIGIGVFSTTRTGVTGIARLFKTELYSGELAFVLQDRGDRRTNRGVVAPIAPAGFGRASASGGLECREPFSGNGMASEYFCKEKQEIRAEVGQGMVTFFVSIPAQVDFRLIFFIDP